MAKNVIKSDPLSEEERAWLNGQPQPSIGEIVAEMNARFKGYKVNSSMGDKDIDKQVRRDFCKYGADDKSIILTGDPETPYARKA